MTPLESFSRLKHLMTRCKHITGTLALVCDAADGVSGWDTTTLCESADTAVASRSSLLALACFEINAEC